MSSPPPVSPLFNRYLPAVSLVLAAIGVPSVVLIAFTNIVATHPWLALGLGVVYEAGVLFVSFLGQVWQKLQLRWVDRITDWADGRIQGMVFRYRRQYFRYLLYQHRDVDVRGLSTQGIYTLNLDQVFVELSIEPKPIHETSSDPLRVPQELRGGSHPIWDYLASASLTDQHLVIIGPPGSGKTTLLKHITLCLVTHRQPQHAHRRQRIPHKVPIVLFLRDLVEKFKGQESYSLVDALHDQLKKWDQPQPPLGWVKREMDGGRCLVMLDGMDEVADPQVRQAVVNWIQRQMVAYPLNRFIITSRPFGYRQHPLSGVTVLEVRPFTPAQVERFVDNWYLANEMMSKQLDDPGVRMRAKVGAQDLLQRLRTTTALYALAVNPLLLTMITTVHRYRGSLPGKRVTLYAEICEVFLGKRQEARGQTLELTPAQMQFVLQPLAYHMMLTGKRDIAIDEAQVLVADPLAYANPQLSPQDFLRLVEQVSGLLLERESGIYAFAHLTFQEYLAAVHIQAEPLEQMLVSQVGASWWHETIRLYCAQADATPIITACLAGSNPTAAKLTLAIECQQEAQRVHPTVKAQLDDLLNHGVEDPDPEKQHIVAEALLARRLRQMVQINEEVYVDTALITCAEYQVFLEEQRAQNNYYQPDHWEGYRFLPGQGRVPVLGVRQKDARTFCEWVTAWENGPWRYRLPREGELEQETHKHVFTGYTENLGYWLDERKGFIRGREIMHSEAQTLLDYIKATLDRVSDSARDFAHDLASDRALDLAHALVLDRARAHASDLDLALDLVYALVLDRALVLASDSDHARAVASDCDLYIDIYITLVVLKGRSEGKLQPYEGILLVREQMRKNITLS